MSLQNNSLDIGPNSGPDKLMRLFYYEAILASGVSVPELDNLVNEDVEKIYWRLVNEGHITINVTGTAVESNLPDRLSQATLDTTYAAVGDLAGKADVGHTHTKAAIGLGNVDNTSDVNKPVSTAQRRAIDRARFEAAGIGAHVGSNRRAFGVETGYASFPVSEVLPDGRIFVVWRGGTDHVTARDGTIEGSYSSDNGITWTPRTVYFDIEGTDFRDPAITVSNDGTKIWMVYFKGSAANAAMGCFFRTSTDNGATWSAESRIESQPYSAICSPVVELSNGNLLATWYGKAVGTDARDSVWTAISTDQGATWSAPVNRANGVALGLDCQEPWASVKGNTVVITYRHGNGSNIGTIRSTDNGSTFSAATASFAGSGRPATVITENGTLVCVYRQSGSLSSNSFMRWSRDNGVTWSGASLLEASITGWMYSGPVEVFPNVIFCANSIELNANTCELSARYIMASAGFSPYGDIIGDPDARVISDRNQVIIADDFNRPTSSSLGRAPNGLLWSSTGGATIREGLLDNRDATNVPKIHSVDANTDSYEIEAELLWSGNPGHGIVFRRVDDTNYHLLTTESSGGNIRLYTIVNGAVPAGGTLLDIATTVPAEGFVKFKVVSIVNLIKVYFENDLLGTVSNSLNNTAKSIGLKTNSVNTSSIHQCRKFVATRRAPVRVG